MTEYSINDRAEFDENPDDFRNYYAADMIQSSNKGICLPKFEMSLNKKINSKSMSMKELYLQKDVLLGESTNLILTSELKVPAGSLEPVYEMQS